MTTMKAATMSADDQARLWGVLQDVPVALLVTDDRGTLRSRPMVACQDDFDGVLWFFTKTGDHKAIELGDNYHVNLSYAAPESGTYVSVSGLAQVVQDAKRQEALWSDEIAEWIPGKATDKDVALLRVAVQQAEYWKGPAIDGSHRRARRAEQHGKVNAA